MSTEKTEPATTIAEYSPTASALAELRQQYSKVVFEVTTTAGMKEARAAAAVLRTHRTDLEKKRVEIKAPALERCRLIDAEAKRLTAELLALEEPIDAQIKSEERRKEAEKQAKIDAEAARVEKIQSRIRELRGAVDLCRRNALMPSQLIGEHLDDLAEVTVEPEEFAEFIDQARAAYAESMQALQDLLRAALDREADEKRRAEERAELERLRAEQAERQRAQEAIERKAAEDRAAADRAAAAERERLAAEQRAAAEAEARAIREKAEAEAAAARGAEMKRAAEQREAEAKRRAAEDAERAERQRIEDEQRAAELKRLREAEAAAREREIAEATLVTAAGDALTLLEQLGQADHFTTLKLRAALARETDQPAPRAPTTKGEWKDESNGDKTP